MNFFKSILFIAILSINSQLFCMEDPFLCKVPVNKATTHADDQSVTTQQETKKMQAELDQLEFERQVKAKNAMASCLPQNTILSDDGHLEQDVQLLQKICQQGWGLPLCEYAGGWQLIKSMHLHTGHTMLSLLCDFNSNNDYLISADRSGKIILWHSEPLTPKFIFEVAPLQLFTAHLFNEVLLLATTDPHGKDIKIRTIDLGKNSDHAMHEVNCIGHTGIVSHLEFMPNLKGKPTLISRSKSRNDKTVRYWNIETGDCEASTPPLIGYQNVVCSAAHSCYQTNRTCYPRTNTGVIIHDKNKSKMVLKGHTGPIQKIACFHTGNKSKKIQGLHRIVTSSADHTLRVWNPFTGECEGILNGHTSTVTDCVHFPIDVNGRDAYLISASKDGVINIWQYIHPQELLIASRSFTENPQEIVSNDEEEINSSALSLLLNSENKNFHAENGLQ